MNIELAKGVRDFLPEDKIFRDDLINKMISVFQRYGYSPLETPSIERLDTLTAKFAAGTDSDAIREIFKFKDQGNRDLGLRFDLTVPFSRVIAMNPTLKMPFKRYEIGRVFRDGPIKLGRYREFWQCDVDIAGCASVKAEAELILLAIDVFKELGLKKLGLDYYIEFNNRKVLYGIMHYCDIPDDLIDSVIISIDKLKKQGVNSVREELINKGLNDDHIKKLFEVLSIDGSINERLNKLRQVMNSEIGIDGLNELEELIGYLGFVESGKIVFNPSLARGLSYYTGIIFEGFLKNSKITSSICAGGRYDNMIGLYAENARSYPAVGISFGLEPITDALKLSSIERKRTLTQLYIIPIQTFKESLIIASELRNAGLNVDIDLMNRGLSKNLDYANSLKIPFVAFIGDSELKENKIKLKNLHTGKEELLDISEVIKKVS
ncbi:MAG: histidine--tRNA ligase 1 [Candidatus Woesearchaeota archaeon]|nr:MAG: histidine--tRNA ligase 1 [Candidatus Woesearchaeota archaeon]